MNGLITIQSDFPAKETIDRLVSLFNTKGITVFSRISHSENAVNNGLQLRPTELIIFGNPKVGTALMQDNQMTGIDLPLKALAWQDEQERVWLTYNDMNWIVARYVLNEKSISTAKALGEATSAACTWAAKKQ
jgi:uncharacterized protein (DUF302 family)